MELRTLRYFLAIVDHGSVTAAARHVHIAQPAISRQMQAFEAEVGVKLFLRDGRRLRLSPAGRRLLPIVRDLIARADSARATMTALAQGIQVHLAVAAHPTTIADVIAPFIASRGAPFATPTFVVSTADAAYDALARAEVDLAISTSPPPRDTASQLVARFPIWAQVPSSHPWAGHDRIGLATLLRQPLVLLDLTHGTRRVFEDEVRRTHGSYRMAAEAGVPGIAQAMAAAGHRSRDPDRRPRLRPPPALHRRRRRPVAHLPSRRLGPDPLRGRGDPRARDRLHTAHGIGTRIRMRRIASS